VVSLSSLWHSLIRWRRRRRREIFRYFDGHRMRAIDPLVAIRELNQHPTFLWSRDVALACEGDAGATRSCVTAVIDVFGAHPLDATGDGLTDEETLAVLSEFMQYLDGLKKSTARYCRVRLRLWPSPRLRRRRLP
jgi:hypothetical protein